MQHLHQQHLAELPLLQQHSLGLLSQSRIQRILIFDIKGSLLSSKNLMSRIVLMGDPKADASAVLHNLPAIVSFKTAPNTWWFRHATSRQANSFPTELI